MFQGNTDRPTDQSYAIAKKNLKLLTIVCANVVNRAAVVTTENIIVYLRSSGLT